MPRLVQYGYQVPVAGDDGPEAFLAIADFMERMAQHDHGGADSPPLTVAASPARTQDVTLAVGDWTTARDDDGLFSTVVATPTTEGGEPLDARARTVTTLVKEGAGDEWTRAFLETRVAQADGRSVTVLANRKLTDLRLKYG